MPLRRQPPQFIALLGSKPQVVTTPLDLLLGQRVDFRRVVVLHTVGLPEVAAAVERLRVEFATYPPYQNLELLLQPLAGLGGPLADVATEADAADAFRAIYRAVLAAKEAGGPVHLSLVGGRKVLSVYGMATAQLLFDDDDRLWYVLARGSFSDSERLHPEPGDEVNLVRVPVLLWSTLSPMLTDLSQIDDPFAAAERQRQLRLREALEEARGFVFGSLSEGERRVVEPLVQEGLSDDQIGARLSLSPRTVENHLSAARQKAAAHWGLASVNRTQLVALLNLYYRWSGSNDKEKYG